MMTLNDYAIKNETDSCMLCHDAPCTVHCPNGQDPARVIRAYRFENFEGARMTVKENDCLTCDSKVCMSHCIKAKIDRTVDIQKVMVDLYHKKNKTS